ncbi:hypothetical protein N665_0593s0016 [Sinapis alba]|nr:hypothetical protein N665_0593s0016 [Sinapis alba]
MDSLTDDLWTMVLARLPIKIFTCFKLVCKQWKSIVESPFFRNLFMSLHQNLASSSSWSLMSPYHVDPEMVDYYYQCDIWGLKRPLSSFINSVLNDKNLNHKYVQLTVLAYSDVGLILIYAMSKNIKKSSIYVVNVVSHECIELFLDPLLDRSQLCFSRWGIATRIENGILLGYKVVVFNPGWSQSMLRCLIYSSETGLWSLDDTSFFSYYYSEDSISLNGILHWLTRFPGGGNQEVVLSMDLYTNSTASDRCRVSHFPDFEKTTKFKRACTPCHGFLMYMNIVSETKVDGSLEDKLCVWRLQSKGWQLISEISPGSILTRFDYVPLTINPFDAKTAYFWSKEQESLLYINLHNGEYVIYYQLELTNDGHTMISAHDPKAAITLKNRYIQEAGFVPFVLPQWLYQIPNTVIRV